MGGGAGGSGRTGLGGSGTQVCPQATQRSAFAPSISASGTRYVAAQLGQAMSIPGSHVPRRRPSCNHLFALW